MAPQTIRFNQDFFQGLLSFGINSGYSNYSLAAFFQSDEENSPIYANFLDAVDPDGQYLDMESVVTVNVNDRGISFFGPSIWQGMEEHKSIQAEDSTQNLVLRIANAFVPVRIEGSKFYAGTLEGTFFCITEQRMEEGKTVTTEKPAVKFKVPGSKDFSFLVEMRPGETGDGKSINYVDIEYAFESEQPIDILLKPAKTGGSGGTEYAPLVQLVYQAGKKEKVFAPVLEIPVIDVEVKDKKDPKPGMPTQFYIIHIDPSYSNQNELNFETDEPVNPHTAFFAQSFALKGLQFGYKKWKERASNGQAVLQISSYKITGKKATITCALADKSVASLPAPTTITVPALASASV